MTTPESHRTQTHERSCGTCRFSKLVAYRLDLLCFHGDTVEVIGQCKYPVTADYVYLDGKEVGLMEGDEYDKVWGKRVVDPDDVCDEWESQETDK